MNEVTSDDPTHHHRPGARHLPDLQSQTYRYGSKNVRQWLPSLPNAFLRKRQSYSCIRHSCPERAELPRQKMGVVRPSFPSQSPGLQRPELVCPKLTPVLSQVVRGTCIPRCDYCLGDDHGSETCPSNPNRANYPSHIGLDRQQLPPLEGADAPLPLKTCASASTRGNADCRGLSAATCTPAGSARVVTWPSTASEPMVTASLQLPRPRY